MAAACDSGHPHSAPSVPLRDVIGGHLAHHAQLILERELNPFVKTCMQRKFPQDPAHPDDYDRAEQARGARAEENRQRAETIRTEELPAAQARLDAALAAGEDTGDKKKECGLARKKVEGLRRELRKAEGVAGFSSTFHAAGSSVTEGQLLASSEADVRAHGEGIGLDRQDCDSLWQVGAVHHMTGWQVRAVNCMSSHDEK